VPRFTQCVTGRPAGNLHRRVAGSRPLRRKRAL
jgi:hypothetical protein